MSWEIGYDEQWERDIGYGVPSICDHPSCNKEIDRGLSYVCGGEPYGGEHGCGLFFCENHLYVSPECSQLCEICYGCGEDFFAPTLDTKEWVLHKATHKSWAKWRNELSAKTVVCTKVKDGMTIIDEETKNKLEAMETMVDDAKLIEDER